MPTRHIGRFTAAVGLALGLLVATALPASATAHDIVITSGSFVIGSGIGSATYDFGHGTTHVCSPNSASSAVPLPADLDSSGGGTIGAVTSVYDDLVISTNSFKYRLVIASGTVVVTGTTLTIALSMTVEYRNCASTTLLCRTNPFTLTLSGANPTGITHPAVSSSFAVSGSSGSLTVGAVPACNTIIRGAILNQPVVGSVDLHVAT